MAAKPKPMPESPGFSETESEGSLRRIAEASRGRRAARLKLASAKADYKAAREDFERACIEEDRVVDGETTELPLFPREASLSPAVSNGSSRLAAAPPGPASPVFLSSLPGFPMTATIALGENGIQTVADLEQFLATDGKLSKFLTKAISEKVRQLLARHHEDQGREAS